MPIITFDDLEVKKEKPIPPKKNIITFDDIPSREAEPKKPQADPWAALAKVEEIGVRPPLSERLMASAKRKAAIIPKSLFGDVPFVRKLLPEGGQFGKVKPYTPAEKWQHGLTRLGRDIGLIMGGEAVPAWLAKVPGVAKAGQIISKVPVVGKVATKVAPYGKEFLRGAGFGAVTADTEDPKEIAKKAGVMGTIFATIPLALKGAGVISQAVWKRVPPQAKDWIRKRGQAIALSIPKTKGYELLKAREAEIGRGEIDSFIFRRELRRNLTKKERELIPFIREKTGLPEKLNRPDLQEAWKMSRGKIEPWVAKVANYLDDGHKFLMDNYGDDIGFIQNYIPHIWDIPKNKEREVVNWFVTRDPHLKKRIIPTLKEGIDKFGLTPKTLDIAEILQIVDQYKIKAVANLRFAKALTNLKDNLGVKLVQRIDKAPDNWAVVDHPALRRAIGRIMTKGEARVLMINKVPVKVHPEIADVVKTVLGKPFQAGRGVTILNAFAKRLNLSLSLFHHTALTETAVATGIGKKTMALWSPFRIFKAFKSGNYGIVKNLPLTKDAVSHGLQLGAVPDVQAHVIYRSLDAAERNLRKGLPRLLGKPAAGLMRALNKANQFWDKGLWDYYHTTLKLYGYEHLTVEMMKQNPNIPAKLVKEEVAQFVNDTFGGQSWNLLVKSPQWRQVAHWLLLAPDWTLSTIRQALSPLGVGAMHEMTRGIRMKLGQKFWQRGFLYFYGGVNLLNKSLTEAHTGKGRYMWENAPGHKTHLFIGYNPDGTERYLRWGKQFREVFEWAMDPIKKLGGKMSPVLREAVIQLSGYTTTGWKTEIAGKPFMSKEGMVARGKEVAKMGLPYSIQQQMRTGFSPFQFAMPVSRGMTPYKARELFKDAIERKDRRTLREIYAATLNNNLNAEKLFKQARSAVKSDITFEFKKEAWKIIEKLQKLGKERGQIEYNRMKGEGEITPELEKQLIKILRDKKEVMKQREKLRWILQ